MNNLHAQGIPYHSGNGWIDAKRPATTPSHSHALTFLSGVINRHRIVCSSITVLVLVLLFFMSNISVQPLQSSLRGTWTVQAISIGGQPIQTLNTQQTFVFESTDENGKRGHWWVMTEPNNQETRNAISQIEKSSYVIDNHLVSHIVVREIFSGQAQPFMSGGRRGIYRMTVDREKLVIASLPEQSAQQLIIVCTRTR